MHLGQVIFKCRAATKADLVILTVNSAVGPREAMGAEQLQKLLEDCWHDWPLESNVLSARLRCGEEYEQKNTMKAPYQHQHHSSCLPSIRPLPLSLSANCLAGASGMGESDPAWKTVGVAVAG